MPNFLEYYSRKEVQKAIVSAAKNKEVAVKYLDEGFGKRPDVLQFNNDVLELAKSGVTSFHLSEEHWSNPLLLKPGMTKNQLDDLRIGWDCILDIDCKFLEFSKEAALLLAEALKFHDIKNFGIKFSVIGDTPILIKIDNIIKLIPIKEAINLFKEGIKIEVLSLDKKGLLTFSKVYNYLEHKDKIYQIYHRQSAIPLRVTGHHSVFSWKNGEIIQKKVSNLSRGDWLITYNSSKKIGKKLKKTIINIFDLNHNQNLKRTFKKKIGVTKELMRLIGYYLADGHITKSINQLGFSFNINEKEYSDDCRRLLKKITKKYISERSPNQGTLQLMIHSKEWYTFFENFCGKGAKNKHLPSFVWSLPKEYFLELLKCYIRGDGYKKGKNSIVIKSVSKTLLLELTWLCKMHNISCTLHTEYNKPHKMPQGTIFKGSFVYILSFPKNEFPIKEFSKKRKKCDTTPFDKVFPTDGLKVVYKQVRPKKFIKHRDELAIIKKRSGSLGRIKKAIKWLEKYNSKKFDKSSLQIINNYKKLYSNDVSVLMIKKIKKGTIKKVYDISVKGTESFFGNDYPILLHNSGGSGFHLGIPFESFPDKVCNQETKLLFPDGVRVIASYLKNLIHEPLSEKILKISKIEEIAKVLSKNKSELLIKNKFNPFSVLEIDSVLISSRHMYRAPYSVAYDEPILIKKRDNIEIINIGEFVDQFFDKEKSFQDKDISNLNLYVISSNLKNLKNRFSKITKVIRHKINEELFHIKLEGGRSIRVTSGHSLFNLKNGKISTIKGNKIKKGEYIVVAKKLPSFVRFKEGDSLMISEEILPHLSEDEKQKTFLSNFDISIFDFIFKNKNLLKNRRENIYNWKRCKILPLDIYEILINREPKLKKYFWNSKIKYSRFSSHTKWLDNKLIINKHLMRLLGYYTAEGHSDKSKSRKNRLCFSFGAHENNLIKDCINGINKCFKIKPIVRNPHKTAKQIIIISSTLRFIFDKFFKCGRTAKDKRVPSLIWVVNDNLKKAYLKSYLDGDGNIDKLWSRNNASTVSNRLKEDLCFLASCFGLNYLLYNQIMFGISKKPSYANKFIISGKNEMDIIGFDSPVNHIKEGIINLLPLKEIGLGSVLLKSGFKNEYIKGNIIRRSKKWIKNNLKFDKALFLYIDKFFEGDLAFLKVKEINKEKPKKNFVYDLSVENDENFIGGNCILLHNSINEKKGLVSIPLTLSQLKNFELKQAKMENVEVDLEFLPLIKKQEASSLIIQAFDSIKKEEKISHLSKSYDTPKIKIKEEFFPPCIIHGLNGIEDGKKRFLFVLLNFLKKSGYDYEQIEQIIESWNKKNKQPLKQGYINSQLSWHKRQKEIILPPNCSNPSYYSDINLCHPDNWCKLITNPVNYSSRKLRIITENNKQKKKRK